MCGRASLTTSPEELEEEYGLSALPPLTPRYNIAPSEPMLAVRPTPTGGREAVFLRWGLVRPGSEDAKAPINLRLESLARGALKATARERRCIVPLSGFYEWKRAGKARQPFNVRRKDGRVFGVAGLWERLESADHSLESCLVLTTAANTVVAPLHDRMPVILDRAADAEWLDPSPQDGGALAGRLRLLAPDTLESYTVSPLVNRAGVEDPRCLEPASPIALW
jgi:putative SOS response-associated peptidase YedK